MPNQMRYANITVLNNHNRELVYTMDCAVGEMGILIL